MTAFVPKLDFGESFVTYASAVDVKLSVIGARVVVVVDVDVDVVVVDVDIVLVVVGGGALVVVGGIVVLGDGPPGWRRTEYAGAGARPKALDWPSFTRRSVRPSPSRSAAASWLGNSASPHTAAVSRIPPVPSPNASDTFAP